MNISFYDFYYNFIQKAMTKSTEEDKTKEYILQFWVI